MDDRMERARTIRFLFEGVLFSAFLFASPVVRIAQAQAGGTSSAAKPVGTIKTISGNAIVLAPDAGPAFNVMVQDGARIVRIEPGAKDLKNAVPAALQDLQVGDRILVLGQVSADGHSVMASSVIVMKKEDLASKREHDQQEWQRHGVGGLVSAVDPAAGAVTISMQSFAGPRSVTVEVSQNTVVRRYAADSVKFDDAKPSALNLIKPGDQVRARGTRSADGSQMAADEVVFGEFRNIAGVITSVDPTTSTLTINDLIGKKPVAVKITAESQLRKLPPQTAQFMAMRLKGGGSESAQGGAGPPRNAPGGGAGRGAAGGDLQQVLSRVPTTSLSELQKGDAVMVVSTEGTGSGGMAVITLLAGVEPILEASPNGGESMVLPPWSFEAPSGDAEQ
jgi:Domain of unknown function (DUF5666)